MQRFRARRRLAGTGDTACLHGRIDTGRIWLPPVLSASRTVDSPTPDRIEITDRFELADLRAVTFFVHSPLLMSVVGSTVFVESRRVRLRIEASWAVYVKEETCWVNFELHSVSPPGTGLSTRPNA